MNRFLKKWKRALGFAGFFSLFINMLQLVFPVYMLIIFDKVLASRSIPTLLTVSVGAVLALVVLACLDFLRSRLLIRVGLSVDQNLTEPVVREMMRDAVRIDSRSYREGIVDINTLRNFLAGNAAFSFFDLPWVPVYVAAIFCMHPLLGWLAVAGILVVLVLGIAQEYLSGPRFTMAKTMERHSGQLLTLGLRNAEVIAGMNMLPGMIAHWKEPYDQALYLQTKAYRFSTALGSVSGSFRTAMQVLVYGLGAYLVLENESTAGVMIAASVIMRQAMGPVDRIMGTWKQTVDARAAYKRLAGLLEAASERPAMELPDPEGKVDVETASLAIGGRPILAGVSFALAPGESMGLIGPSGAGKSSLCRLLLGIWGATSGTVRLDGADIATWDRDALGRHIGYLPQDVELFAGTVSENIARMGTVEPEKVVEAATLAGIHDMVLRLPQGYDTQIGDLGMQLSGGQRQLIGLARVFYGGPKFVILDEPNSNLDDSGERALGQALRELKARRVTTVMVTHKPSLLASADKVLVLKEGRSAFFGPREEVFQAMAAASAGRA
ncbi:MAG: type I secretion system permease/ATPase [Deltaproteobacteria bacterium]|nr:type I secretion system permease/ATPase [Deltaproteobacteria bacterium]